MVINEDEVIMTIILINKRTQSGGMMNDAMGEDMYIYRIY